jgi:hypothetical protein
MRDLVFTYQLGQFALTKDQDGAYFIEVLCGGFAMYEVQMQLHVDEIASYLASGPDSLVGVADRIRRKSQDLGERVREK